MRGRLYVFEGPDGCGKSTIINKLLEMDKEVYLAREPGGTVNGELIRNILLNKGDKLTYKAEALLMAASRAELVEKVLYPKLEAGIDIFLDRYFISSLVYQGYARGLGIEEIYDLNKMAISGLIPDITLYFDLSYDEALKRRDTRNTRDKIEDSGEDFIKKVHEGYEEVFKRYSNDLNIIRIKANQPVEAVFNDVIKIIGGKYETYYSNSSR